MVDSLNSAVVICLIILIVYALVQAQLAIINIIKAFGLPTAFDEGSAVWYLNPHDSGVEKLVIINGEGIYLTIPFNPLAKRYQNKPLVPITKAMAYKKIAKLPADCFFSGKTLTIHDMSLSNALQKASSLTNGEQNQQLLNVPDCVYCLRKYYADYMF